MGVLSNDARRVPGRAWVMLAAAGVSALGLVVVALGAVGPATDPALAGEATLARLAGEVADGVVEEWERLRRAPDPFPGGMEWRWQVEPPVEKGALDFAPVESVVLDALLAETVRRSGSSRAPASCGS